MLPRAHQIGSPFAEVGLRLRRAAVVVDVDFAPEAVDDALQQVDAAAASAAHLDLATRCHVAVGRHVLAILGAREIGLLDQIKITVAIDVSKERAPITAVADRYREPYKRCLE